MSRSSDDSSSSSWVGMPSGGGGWSTAVVAVSSVLLGAAAIYSWKRFRRAGQDSHGNQDLQGLTVCVTGASEGIGRAVALNLGQRGATLLLGCRNVARGEQLVKQLHPVSATVIPLDLANLPSIQEFCSRVKALAGDSGIQVLINNAGAMIREEDKEVVLDNGTVMDRAMVVNHLGWFQLTQQLMPLLEKGAQQPPSRAATTTNPLLLRSRVINVGSRLEKRGKLADPFADRWLYDSPVPYSPFLAYSNSKLAMSATTFHWARQLEGTSVQMMLVTPGMVHTSLPRFMPFWVRILSYPVRAMCLKTPEQGAETVLFAATDKDVQNGKYYGECEEITSSVVASAPSVGRRIYEASVRVVEERQRGQPQPQQ